MAVGDGTKSFLIVSDDEEPEAQIRLEAGMKFEVVSLKIVDASLKESGAIAARLCGGSGTCLALMMIDAPAE